MPTLTSRRLVDILATAALTVYAVGSVAVWALSLWLVARRSGAGVTRDIF